ERPLVERHGRFVAVGPSEADSAVLRLWLSAEPANDGLFDVSVLAHDAATFATSRTRTRPLRRSCVTGFLMHWICACLTTSASTCWRCCSERSEMACCSLRVGTGTASFLSVR